MALIYVVLNITFQSGAIELITARQNKRLDSKQKTIEAFIIQAKGFRKTRNENALTRETEVAG